MSIASREQSRDCAARSEEPAPGTGAALILHGARLVFLGIATAFVAYYVYDFSRVRQGALKVVHGRVASAPGATQRFLEIRGQHKDTISVDLAAQAAILLVYSRRCDVCRENMPRWFDLVLELAQDRSSTPVWAVGLDEDSTASAYWRGIPGVRVIQPIDRAAFLATFGLIGTPTTIAVGTDTTQVSLVGFLGPWRRAYVRSFIREHGHA